MKWIQYKVYTTTDAAEIIGELLCELGIQGFEISDHVPPTPEEENKCTRISRQTWDRMTVNLS